MSDQLELTEAEKGAARIMQEHGRVNIFLADMSASAEGYLTIMSALSLCDLLRKHGYKIVKQLAIAHRV